VTKYGGRELEIAFNGTFIGQVMSFPPFGWEAAEIPASAYGEEWTDTIPGQLDGVAGTLTIAADVADAGQDAVEAAAVADASTINVWTVTHTGGAGQWDISARTLGVRREGQLDGVLTMFVDIKIVEPGVVQTSS
jgi:hypothetical protein